MTLNLV